ncbi:hypothetical protein ACI2K4_35465 [Micromonospora sp. NPDC050397]|uniref:hypothetical protein n=1 Tax=Micromonospora sp. NPDC050397 TaxID=3364279 RepID=UPI00384C5750
MRKTTAAMSAVMLGLALTQGAAHAAPSEQAAPPQQPAGANPFLAELGSDAGVDYHAWTTYLKSQSAVKAKERLTTLSKENSSLLSVAKATPEVVREQTPDRTTGPANAQKVTVFGTDEGKAPKISVKGNLRADDDQDFYAIRLRAGDVLGASVSGSATSLNIYDSAGHLVKGSTEDLTSIYPASSPLPGGGNAANDHVAVYTGWYYLSVGAGSGAYDITVEGYRPPLEGAKPTQTLFLDFDGARADSGRNGGGRVTLSPFRDSITKWGLKKSDENRLIDAIVAEIKENLQEDMVKTGLNKRFNLKITNSKDDPDTWGQANVSRVVIGGTNEEFGAHTPLPIFGTATDVDPGNFETEETAFILMDLPTAPAGPVNSLNTYLQPGGNKIAFLGQALGTAASHEAGHMFGNFHTDGTDAQFNVMDADLSTYNELFGVGKDGIGGTADDVDVDFGEDAFRPAEGFTGIEDTMNRISFGLTR